MNSNIFLGLEWCEFLFESLVLLEPQTLEIVDHLWEKHGRRRDKACLELFAGWAGISASFIERGFGALAYDRQKMKEQDFCTNLGWSIAVFFALRIQELGLVVGGPQCSTWIAMSIGHTYREVAISGDTSRHDVQEGCEKVVPSMHISDLAFSCFAKFKKLTRKGN